MESPVTVIPERRPLIRILFARSLQRVGSAGMIGIGLVIAAMPLAWNAVSAHRHIARITGEAANPSPRLLAAESQASPALEKLPTRGDIPELLKKIESAATRNGLSWSAAEYRFVAATGTNPAAIEIRCAFRAPYPRVRAMLVDVFGSVRAVTIRELNFSRESIDSADVDAKVVMAMFLSDDRPAGDTGGP
jgi:hypothetical protein